MEAGAETSAMAMAQTEAGVETAATEAGEETSVAVAMAAEKRRDCCASKCGRSDSCIGADGRA